MKSHKITTIMALALVFSASANAFVSESQLLEIDNRINSMSYNELTAKKSSLIEEKSMLDKEPDSEKKENRILVIASELSAIQKALVAIAGVAAINALTDDGYYDDVPPVITLSGSSSVTVELGSAYGDAGATAVDAFHGPTPVSVSGSVDTTSVGAYTITYR